MILELLRKNGWKQWPRSHSTDAFVDSTDELHPLNGDYTNTFAGVFKEGTYTLVDLRGRARTPGPTASTGG